MIDPWRSDVCPACGNYCQAPVSRAAPDDWLQKLGAAYAAGRSHDGPAPASVPCIRCGQLVPPEVRAAQERELEEGSKEHAK